MLTDILGIIDGTRMADFRGAGYFAGEPPVSGEPDSIDGRFRILNVPTRGRIAVFERGSMLPVASTLSAADGTWRIDWLDPARQFVVLGFDDTGVQNAAVQDWVSPAPM